MYARLRSQVSAPSESGSPCENAKPALVVASAGNPSCCRYRAEPTSHGFGITKQPASCRARNARRRALKFSCDPRPSVPLRCVVIGSSALVHHAHATPAQFLKDAVVRNPNSEERIRSCHSSASRVWPTLVAFDLVRRHQYGSAFVFHEEHDEFRRFGLARVPPNDVNIRGTFIEGLAGRQSHFFPAPHLHHD